MPSKKCNLIPQSVDNMSKEAKAFFTGSKAKNILSTVAGLMNNSFDDAISNEIKKNKNKNKLYSSRSLNLILDDNNKIPDLYKYASGAAILKGISANTSALKNKQTISEIKSTHNLDDYGLTDKQLLELSNATGLPVNKFLSSIGNDIFNISGVKLDENEPSKHYSNIKMSLAKAALDSMISEGVLYVKEMPVTKYQKLLGLNDKEIKKLQKDGDFYHDTTVKFITFNTSASNKSKIEGLSVISKIKSEDSGVSELNEIFNDVYKARANHKPFEVDSSIQRSPANLEESSLQYQKLKDENNDPYEVNDFAKHVMNNKTLRAMLLMSEGFKPLDDSKSYIEANKLSIESKNDNIKNDLEKFDDFMGTINSKNKNKPIFFNHLVFRNARIMIDSIFNPQASTMHRQLVTKNMMKGILTKGSNSQEEKNFFRAIAQGLHEDPALDNDKIVKKNFDVVNDKFGALAKTIYTMQDGETLSKSEKELFDEALEEKTASFKALYELGKYNAVINGVSVETTIQYETDATNSGLMHRLLQYPLFKTKEDLEKAFGSIGISINKKDISDIFDAYEDLGAFFLESNSPLAKGLEQLLGGLTDEDGKPSRVTRSIMKFPVLTFLYGAGMASVKRTMSGGIEQKLYDQLEKIMNSPESEFKKVSAANKIMRGFNFRAFNSYADITRFNGLNDMERRTLSQSMDFIDKYFDDKYGAITDKIDNDIEIMQVSFDIMDGIMNIQKKKLIDEHNKSVDVQQESDDNAYMNKVETFEHLPSKVKKEFLEDIVSKFGFKYKANTYSQSNGMDIYTFKSTTINNPEHSTEFSSTQQSKYRTNKSNKLGTEERLRDTTTKYEALYSGGSVYYTHATEALLQIKSVFGLNVFDASVDGIVKSEDVAPRLNKNSFIIDINKFQSLETIDAFGYVIDALLDYTTSDDASIDDKVEISKIVSNAEYNLKNRYSKKKGRLKNSIDSIFRLYEKASNDMLEVNQAKIDLLSKDINMNNFAGVNSGVDFNNVLNEDESLSKFYKEYIPEKTKIDLNALKSKEVILNAFLGSSFKTSKSNTSSNKSEEAKKKLKDLENKDLLFSDETSTGKDLNSKKKTSNKIEDKIDLENIYNKIKIEDNISITGSEYKYLDRIFNEYISKSSVIADTIADYVINTDSKDSSINTGSINIFKKNINITKAELDLKLYESKSLQEVIVHELLHIPVAEMFSLSNYPEHVAIEKMYDYIKNKITIDMLTPDKATSNQKKYAESLYKYVFDDNPKMSKKVQMQEFMVHAVSNKLFRDGVQSILKDSNDLNLSNDYGQILNLINKLTNSFGSINKEDQIAKILLSLSGSGNLANVISKASVLKNSLFYADSAISKKIDEFGKRQEEEFIKILDDETLTKEEMDSKLNTKKWFVPKFWEDTRENMYDNLYDRGNNLIADSLKQVFLLPKKFKESRIFINKSRAAIEIAGSNSEQLEIEAFNKSTDNQFNDSEKEELTTLLYKTEMVDLHELNHKKLLDEKSNDYIDNMINKTVNKLKDIPNHEFMNMQAQMLGSFMIDPDNTKGFILKNGYSIYKTTRSKNISGLTEYELDKDKQQSLIILLDKLISLYAVKKAKSHISKETLTKLNNLKEFDDIVSRQMETHRYYLTQHFKKSITHWKDFSILHKSASWNRFSAIKGLVPVKYNNTVDFKIIHEDQIADYVDKKWYKLIDETPAVKLPNGDYYLVGRIERSIKSHLRGSMSSYRPSTETINMSSIIDSSTIDTEDFMHEVKKDVKHALEYQVQNNKPYNKNIPSAIIDKDGMIKNIQININKSMEEEFLVRENKADRISGMMRKDITLKHGSFNADKDLYEYLRKIEPELKKGTYYVIDSATNPDKYKKLSDTFKSFITRDKKAIFIPKILYNEVMGIDITPFTEWDTGKKLNIKEFFEDKPKMKILVDGLEKITADIHSSNRKKEVLLTPDTWIGNILSNVTHLTLTGIPIDKIVKETKNLIMMTEDYHELMKEEASIWSKSKEKRTNKDNARLKDIKAALEDNLVNWAFENGFYESLVDDMADAEVGDNRNIMEDYVSKFRDDIEKKVPIAGKIMREAYMNDGTYAGRLSQKILANGDFFAKIISFKSQENKKSEELKRSLTQDEKLEIMNEINSMFINYGVVTSSSLEYLNRMGFFYYGKFILGIPATLLKTAKTNAASVSAMVATEMGLDVDIESFDDSFNANTLSNRFRSTTEAVENIMTPIWYDIIKKYI